MEEINFAYELNKKNAEAGRAILAEFEKTCDDPRKAMEECLLKLMKDNADTEYGKKYHFDQIHSLEDYKACVPVITYDDIASDVERMEKGEQNILTVYPYHHFNETSGTVGKRKAVPLTSEQEKVFMKYGNQIYAGVLDKDLGEEWKKGKSYCTSQGNHITLESGMTLGCASSIMADICKGGKEPYSSMFKGMFTSPPEAMKPSIGTDSTYMHVRFAMMEKNLTGITTGFISTICSHMSYLRDNYQLIINDIENGTIDPSIEIPEEDRESLLKKLSPMPERASELREIFKDGADFPFIKKVWPKLEYLTGAGGDGFTVYDKMFNREFSAGAVKRLFMGITASEGIYSVPIAVSDHRSAIIPDAGVIEFLPVEAGDDFSKICQIDELEVGKIYELIITNFCGFYRYRMSDAVKVMDFWHKTPLVQFMYRVNKTINLACEKTTEEALRVAAEGIAERLGFELFDYEVYPDTESFPPKYVFLIETDDDVKLRVSKEELDKVACEEICKANGEFEECYGCGELLGPDCFFEEAQTQLLYQDKQVFKGANRSQIKPVHVIANKEQHDFFMAMRNLWED